jgi:hypothetical protein
MKSKEFPDPVEFMRGLRLSDSWSKENSVKDQSMHSPVSNGASQSSESVRLQVNFSQRKRPYGSNYNGIEESKSKDAPMLIDNFKNHLEPKMERIREAK